MTAEPSSLSSRLFRTAPTCRAAPTVAVEIAAKFKGTLIAKGLTKSYKGRQVVNGVSLGVRAGEAVGLLGPNGAGKTTCFYMVTGLVPVDEGTIEIDGFDVTSMPMYRRARLGIGYLPQEASIFRGLTVEQNIRAVLEVVEKSRKEREHSPRRAARGIPHQRICASRRRCRFPAASGGASKSRARLASRPHYMLLDEPFAGIDPIAVADIQQLVRHLTARGIGVLDHRPQCARDARSDRPRLHHPCRRGADAWPAPTKSSPIPMCGGSISARVSRSERRRSASPKRRLEFAARVRRDRFYSDFALR